MFKLLVENISNGKSSRGKVKNRLLLMKLIFWNVQYKCKFMYLECLRKNIKIKK